ncbi:nitroreductase family protein [Chlorobium sp. KB01]|uniref:nitroreductase family protein n=1 Tax=Chlorobium sp. KB01 TaxID=1917528 RepID=UPI00097862BC|nr:nitroreductase family protein [Chlorobium sp. KB01]
MTRYMNNTIETILRRRSIRAYEPRQLEEDELNTILQAGQYAPSAMGQQPWHFTVIEYHDKLETLQSACKNVFLYSDNAALRETAAKDGYHVFYHAPMLLIISADSYAVAPREDCVLAMENMLLAAASLGIASCWVHSPIILYQSAGGPQTFAEIGVRFPEGHQPYASAVFGYSAKPWPDAAPRKPGTVTRIG